MNNEPLLYTIKAIETHEGYEVLKEDFIKCASCNKSLVEIVKVKEDPSRVHIIIAECPFCGDASFRYKIEGVIYISGVATTTIVDTLTEVKDDKMYSTIKVAKNG
jgi:transcription elongation factor Elf1